MTESDTQWQNNQRRKSQRQTQSRYVKEERLNRREDWICGSRLAPKRDAGVLAEKYGTVDQTLLQPVNRRSEDRLRTWLADGDRVVLLEGIDKGKIAQVIGVDEDSQTVKLNGLNKVCCSPFTHPRTMDGRTDSSVPRSTSGCPHTCVEKTRTRDPSWHSLQPSHGQP